MGGYRMLPGVPCDLCGSLLSIDETATLNEYMVESEHKVDVEGDIMEESIQQYLVYKCVHCGRSYKFTYKDIELRFRLYIAERVMVAKKIKMLKTINPYSVKEENGIEYCGQCDGYGGDGNGYCLRDIIRQCTIKK